MRQEFNALRPQCVFRFPQTGRTKVLRLGIELLLTLRGMHRAQGNQAGRKSKRAADGQHGSPPYATQEERIRRTVVGLKSKSVNVHHRNCASHNQTIARQGGCFPLNQYHYTNGVRAFPFKCNRIFEQWAGDYRFVLANRNRDTEIVPYVPGDVRDQALSDAGFRDNDDTFGRLILTGQNNYRGKHQTTDKKPKEYCVLSKLCFHLPYSIKKPQRLSLGFSGSFDLY